MKTSIKLAAMLTAFAVAGSSSAAVINFQTGFSDAGAQLNAAAYQSVVDAAVSVASAGYGSGVLSSYDNVSNQSIFGGSSSNIAFKSTINFGVTAADAGSWQFRAGVDFGKGGAVFLDGHAVSTNTSDMWWAGNYGNTSSVFAFGSNLSAGNHTVTIYGLEGCCDGGQQVQFNPGSGFQSFSAGSLAPVPEPETYGMLLAGLGFVGFVARRRKARNAA